MKALELLKKYKLYIVSALLMIFFFRSCGKSREITRLNKKYEIEISKKDSIISSQIEVIDSMHTSHYVDLEMLDNWISSRDRDKQLMELQPIVKDMMMKVYRKK